MGAWGSCRIAGKEGPEAKAAPRCQNHPTVAARRPALLVDPGAGRAELGASLCWLCLCYPGSAAWPPPVCVVEGPDSLNPAWQQQQTCLVEVDPNMRSTLPLKTPGEWKEQKRKENATETHPCSGRAGGM
ncbi:hypothetical protein NDU88_004078 [Pleurodeles waltl]|uniref:Uncharacterized protein n=1 Tax=Pleurodeles waltl TaxID=8319 RepID=A0AAV7PCZ2_PLEWA|nr:hypothetical protein NDU88_004078 [Pleurodeles waltl]